MSQLIYLMISLVTKLHTKLLTINDNSGLALSDKQLHFIIIGLFGFGLCAVVQPLFEWFSKHNGVLFITFAYVFTIVMVLTFAIEIGQGFSGTGDMDFYDLFAGVFGFFVFFAIYLICYLIYERIIKPRVYDGLNSDDVKKDE